MPALSDLQTLATDIIDHPIDDGSKITETRVNASINRGYRRWAIETRCFSNYTTAVATTIGATSVALPDDWLEVKQVSFQTGTTVTWLGAREIALEDATDPSWRSDTSGTPDSWARMGANKLRIFPAVSLADGTTGVFNLYGDVAPSATSGALVGQLSTTASTPALPYDYQEAPALWAAADLAELWLPDDEAAQRAGQGALRRYNNMVKEFRASLVTAAAWR